MYTVVFYMTVFLGLILYALNYSVDPFYFDLSSVTMEEPRLIQIDSSQDSHTQTTAIMRCREQCWYSESSMLLVEKVTMLPRCCVQP